MCCRGPEVFSNPDLELYTRSTNTLSGTQIAATPAREALHFLVLVCKRIELGKIAYRHLIRSNEGGPQWLRLKITLTVDPGQKEQRAAIS